MISVLLNGTLLQLEDWPSVDIKTFWEFILQIGGYLIFYLGFIGSGSVLALWIFSYFLAGVAKAVYRSTVDSNVSGIERQHIEAVLEERTTNTFIVLSEVFLVYAKINGLF